jgi:hypothetical protein
LPGNEEDGVDIKAALKSQYHAALAMLEPAIEECPVELWAREHPASPYWQIAYHVLFFTHLYMIQNEDAFTPWEHHREETQFLGELPWPPHDPPNSGEPYTREQVLAYWRAVDGMVDATIDAVDLEAEDCGFWWYELTKLEHEWMNVRHIQHHTGQMRDRLAEFVQLPDWMGGMPPQ